MDVASWLRNLGLERYEDAFRENAVGADVLCDLTAEDLEGLGVAAIGHRRRQRGPPDVFLSILSSATALLQPSSASCSCRRIVVKC